MGDWPIDFWFNLFLCHEDYDVYVKSLCPTRIMNWFCQGMEFYKQV